MFNQLECKADRDSVRNYAHVCASGGREKSMSEIKVKDNESLDNALRRFKRQCAKSGVLSEVRKREHYEKPSVRRKKKSEAARRKNAKKF